MGALLAHSSPSGTHVTSVRRCPLEASAWKYGFQEEGDDDVHLISTSRDHFCARLRAHCAVTRGNSRQKSGAIFLKVSNVI